MKTKISPKNSKIGNIDNVSLTPIKSCGNCDRCKDKCYAMKSYNMYPNVKVAWDHNFKLVQENRIQFFNDIMDHIQKASPRFFRWHVSGDILDKDYFHEMVQLAKFFPNTKFLAFTKMYSIVNNYQAIIPSNLTVVFSVWPGLEIDNPHNLPMAFCQDGTETRHIQHDHIECPGYCETCGMCWELPKLDINVLFNIH